MFRLMSVLGCVLMLLGSDAALGRETIEHIPLGRSAVSISTCPGTYLYSRVGQGMGVHHARMASTQHACATPVSNGPEDAERAASEDFERVALRQNCPNPFNPITVMEYTVNDQTHGRLAIYGSSGRLVRVLVDEVAGEGGPHTVTWNGTNDEGQALPSGVYFARLEAGGETATRKVVLLK